jgi:amino-acid N-acetyltransferase
MMAIDAGTPLIPVVRSATPADLGAVERLLSDSELPVAGVAEIFAANADDFLVAEVPGGAGPSRVIGTAGLEVRGGDALLRSAAVDPEWRSRGLGARLTTELLALAEARGIRTLYLLTTTAEGFFPRFGFIRITRADVSPAIADTVEFREACPASAVVMARVTRGPTGAPVT